MKKTTKVISALLAAAAISTAVTACGGDKKPEATPVPSGEPTPAVVASSDPGNAQAGGQTVEWGKYSVLAPEGFKLVEAGDFSPYDFSVKKSEFSYFDFNTEADDETMMNKYNYNKQTYTNEQVDFEETYGANKWTGFQYSDGFGGFGFEAYTTIGEKIVRVSSAGFKYDSEQAKAVLESLTLK